MSIAVNYKRGESGLVVPEYIETRTSSPLTPKSTSAMAVLETNPWVLKGVAVTLSGASFSAAAGDRYFNVMSGSTVLLTFAGTVGTSATNNALFLGSFDNLNIFPSTPGDVLQVATSGGFSAGGFWYTILWART